MRPEQETDRREMSLRAKLSLPESAEPPWSLFTALLTVGVMLLCLTLLGPALASLISGSGSGELTSMTLMFSWAIGMAMTCAFVLVSRRGNRASWRAMRMSRGNLPLPMALFLGIAMALALDLLVSLLSGDFLPPPQIWGFHSGGIPGLLLAALMAVLLQPLAETLVFQAALLPRLRWTLGPWGGIIATALIYAGLHQLVFLAAYEHYHPLWHGLLWPLGIGILFCLLRVYTGSSSATLMGRVGAGLVFLLTALAIYA